MKDENKCYHCGSANLEPGAVQSAGTVSFRPANARFFRLSPGNVPIAAKVCMGCGNIKLTADVSKIATLTGEPARYTGQ